MLDTHLKEHTIVTEFLSSLIEADNACLLAINGWHAPWADTFMYAFSGKWIWIPLYASLLYVIGRNLRWQVAVGCAVAIALTIVFADQVGASLIRPEVARLRPSNLENPLSAMVPSSTAIGAGATASLRAMRPTPSAWPSSWSTSSVAGCSRPSSWRGRW